MQVKIKREWRKNSGNQIRIEPLRVEECSGSGGGDDIKNRQKFTVAISLFSRHLLPLQFIPLSLPLSLFIQHQMMGNSCQD